MTMTGERLSPDERHEIHNARVEELQAGEISGKEFVFSLHSQVGFHELDAKRQWQDMKDLGVIPIYSAKVGDAVKFKTELHGWIDAKIVSFYSSAGVVVGLPSGLTLPFSLFELRLK